MNNFTQTPPPPRENNFDFVRLFAALQVFLIHATTHLQLESDNLIIQYLSLFRGVIMFFTISGFLIFWSLDRNADLKNYFRNRFLRLYPALWACLAVTLTLLLFFRVISLTDLFGATMLKWIAAQSTIFHFWTPDLLRKWGVGTPNGSLWTIVVEIQFYFLLPLILLTFRRIKLLYKLLILIALSVFFNYSLGIALSGKETLMAKIGFVTIGPYLYFFIFGMLLYYYWHYIKFAIEGKALYWLIFLVVYCKIAGQAPAYYQQNFQLIPNILLSILTVSLAFTKPQWGHILRGNDISYGLYIYHMLVINSLVALGCVGEIHYLIIALLVTVFLSTCSWFFIEKKALKLKRK